MTVGAVRSPRAQGARRRREATTTQEREDPRIHTYATEASVSLHVQGDDLDPDEVTALLGYPPTRGRRKGDLLGASGVPRRMIAWTGSWTRRVAYRRNGDLDFQIEEILAPLTTDLTIWRGLAERFEVYLFVGVFVQAWNQHLELHPETTAALGIRGIRIEFDVYGRDPADGPEA